MLGIDILVALPGLENQDVIVKIPGLFSAPRLVVGGRPASHGAGKDTYMLKAPDGTTKTIVLKRGLINPVPLLECNGVRVTVMRPFGWRQHLWIWLPVVLLSLGGGFLGALVGGFTAYVNARILCQPGSARGRYTLIGLVVVAAAGTILLLRVAAIGLLGTGLMLLLFGRWSCSELTFRGTERNGLGTIPVEVTVADERAHEALAWVATQVANGNATGGRDGRWLIEDFQAFTRERNVDPLAVQTPVFIIRGTPVFITPINHCL